jgi:hypothetical protein
MQITKTQKKVLYFLPILIVGGYGLILLYKKYKENAGLNPTGVKRLNLNPKSLNKTDIATKTVSVSSIYPLKKGVTSDAVKFLQQYLDVTPVTGYWGDKTEAAANEQLGVNHIDSADDLNNAINTILSNDSESMEKINKSHNILDEYNKAASNYGNIPSPTNNLGNIVFGKNTTIYTVDGNYFMNITANHKLNLNDYVPTSIDADNNLIILCTTGANSGSWVVNPTVVTLQIN